MHCTIGIPAHNEEKSLPILLESLKQQRLPKDRLLKIVVIANGCTDQTTRVALDFGKENWGKLKTGRDNAHSLWSFGDGFRSFSVCEVALASKSNALNIIHEQAEEGIVLLFDGDVRLGPEVVEKMYQAFLRFPKYGAVAARYRGVIPLAGRSDSSISEWCRWHVSKAINHFDSRSVRLDGKGYGYRHSLLDEKHPSIIPVDMWLEGVAWRDSAGCIYLEDQYVEYRFPQTFEQLKTQYIRYSKSIHVFTKDYPELYSSLQRGRKLSNISLRRPALRHRLIGWLFLSWIEGQARNTSKYTEGEKWKVIPSTKTWN